MTSVAMMLRYSFSLEAEASAVEHAITTVLEQGHRTADIAADKQKAISTNEMTSHIISALQLT